MAENYTEFSHEPSGLIVDFRLPSDLEMAKRKEFTTYRNYLRAVVDVFPLAESVGKIVGSEKFQRIYPRKVDLDEVGKLVRLAWVTEATLYSPNGTPAAQGVCRQSYYAVYSILRALFAAMGTNTPRSHSAYLNAFADLAGQRAELLPELLATRAFGDPNGSTFKIEVPSDIDIREVSTIAPYREENAWSLVAKLFKTTRARQMDEAVQNWKSRNQKTRIPRLARSNEADLLRPTSLLHCLYRLRVRSDYKDADMFLFGMLRAEEESDFCSTVGALTHSVLGSLELLIARYAGRAAIESSLEQIINNDKSCAFEETIVPRWELLSTYL